MSKSACIVVRHLPLSLNVTSRRHWSVRTKERDQLTILVSQAMREYGATPISGPYRLHITFFVPTRKRWDASNRLKNLLDAIVRAGLVEDDGAPLLVSESYSVRLDPNNPRTEITVHQADAPAWEAAPRARRKGSTAA